MKFKKGELTELYKVMFTEYPDILTITQVQKMLGVSRHLSYDLIKDGYINGIKVGNAFRVPKISVINYVLEVEQEKRKEKEIHTTCNRN